MPRQWPLLSAAPPPGSTPAAAATRAEISTDRWPAPNEPCGAADGPGRQYSGLLCSARQRRGGCPRGGRPEAGQLGGSSSTASSRSSRGRGCCGSSLTAATNPSQRAPKPVSGSSSADARCIPSARRDGSGCRLPRGGAGCRERSPLPRHVVVQGSGCRSPSRSRHGHSLAIHGRRGGGPGSSPGGPGSSPRSRPGSRFSGRGAEAEGFSAGDGCSGDGGS